ncbi:probable beta-hexosaminidase fdl isoform X2 [Periplaneta americana]|uniref:probable beta-hexosaminidase fdl isoform X2 n=1 Tax=Periplaneta americana TaxID=6978 RepID=UPI0037E71807
MKPAKLPDKHGHFSSEMAVRSERLRKWLFTLMVFSVGVIALLYWGKLEDLQAAFRSTKPRAVESAWTWVCEEQQCVRREREGDLKHSPRSSLASCRMVCGPAPLWPRPTGAADLGVQSSPFSLQALRFELSGITRSPRVRALLDKAAEIFRGNLRALVPGLSPDDSGDDRLNEFVVALRVLSLEEDPLLRLSTNESYSIAVRLKGRVLRADVTAVSFYGARHGLETLSQLVWWDDSSLRVLTKADIRDEPRFAHRGLLVDTARNFLPLQALRRTVDALAACKLNALHWHLTDSQSFPFDSPRVPNMARYGAYGPDKVYSARDVADLVAYARVRGVRVLVEIDAPAHAGNGWQWGPLAGLGNLSVCINQQPWIRFCGEPPCGQLNPDNEHTYQVLGSIYRDLVELTNVTDMFHMGGDEVNLNCWATALEESLTHEQLMDKWGYFQSRALRRLAAANGGALPRAVVLWSSQITKPHYAHSFLDRNIYVVQTWGVSDWGEASSLLRDGYRVILSHLDAWYLDCGFGNWRGPGPGACNPVSTWQKVYQHRPWVDMQLTQEKMALVLGGEACLWAEMVDDNSLDMKLWPRAAAFAERMWTDPEKDEERPEREDQNLRDAHVRLSVQRERLLSRGIKTDAMWPEWCNQNPSMCLEPIEPDSITRGDLVKTDGSPHNRVS